MKKKGLSLLSALSMVFTMNAVAFAGETTDPTEVIKEAYGYDDTESYNSQSTDSYVQSLNGTTLSLYVGNSTPYYTGKKITADDLGVVLYDSETKYTVPVKKIKLTGTNKKKTATGAITYKMTGIYNWKYLNDTKADGNYSSGALKSAYKSIKSKFKSVKSTELKAYITPHYIESSVSATAVKTLKKNKSLSDGDLQIDANGDGDPESIKDCVIVNTKNSGVKSVQIPVIKRKYLQYKNSDGSHDGRAYKLKVSLKKLRKGKDYTVSGDVITFKDSSTFSGVGSFKSR